jgi:DNA-binding XRE family transcriptional regulator
VNTAVTASVTEGIGSSFDEFMEEYESSMGPGDRALYQVFARKNDFSSQVIGLRKARKLTQQQLAVLANVHQSEISRIERGVANPHVSTLEDVATALGARLRLVPS